MERKEKMGRNEKMERDKKIGSDETTDRDEKIESNERMEMDEKTGGSIGMKMDGRMEQVGKMEREVGRTMGIGKDEVIFEVGERRDEEWSEEWEERYWEVRDGRGGRLWCWMMILRGFRRCMGCLFIRMRGWRVSGRGCLGRRGCFLY